MANLITKTCEVCGFLYSVPPHLSKSRKVCGTACRDIITAKTRLPRPATFNAETNTYSIPLTKGHFAEVDAEDSDLADFRWYAVVSEKKGLVYAARHKSRLEGKGTILMHRVIIERSLGRPFPKSELCDHEDGCGTNNTRKNLRPATGTQNNANQRLSSQNTSGYKGVSYEKRRNLWEAYIKVNGKKKFLGYFPTAKLAHEAYCKTAAELFGEFARFR